MIVPTRQLLPWLGSLALLGGILAGRLTFHTPSPDALAHHDRVRAAGAELPLDFDEWRGKDAPENRGAVRLLHPTILISRQYANPRGQVINMLVVHCPDARDLDGHFPARCYPGQGWIIDKVQQENWVVDGLTLHGTRYDMTLPDDARPRKQIVMNFMMLPDGRTCPDMTGVNEVMRDYRRRYYGVGEFQAIIDANFSDAERQEMFEIIVRRCRPLIERICSGVDNHDR